MKHLRGKRALITGAASGIGRAVALELARNGTHLFLVDIDAAGLEGVAAEARALGVETIVHVADLTQPAQITVAVERVLALRGGPDILVNNAGIAYYGPTHKMTVGQWDRLLGVNLLAPLQLTRELLPSLLERTEAHVLNVCSISGLVAGGRFAAYHVSKFGLVGFSEALRAEYGRRGLGVTALCPGPVLTNLYKSAMSGRSDRAVPSPPAWLCVSEESVARSAVRAIRRNRRMVLVGLLAQVLFQLKRFLPGMLDLIQHIGRRKKQPTTAPVEVAQRRAA